MVSSANLANTSPHVPKSFNHLRLKEQKAQLSKLKEEDSYNNHRHVSYTGNSEKKEKANFIQRLVFNGTKITVTPTPTPTIRTLKNDNGITILHSSDNKNTEIYLDTGSQNASLIFLNNGQNPIFGTTDPNAKFLVDGNPNTTVETIYNRIQKGEETTIIFEDGSSLSIEKNKKGGFNVEVLRADEETCTTEITSNGDGTHTMGPVDRADISKP